jgi:anti-sigma-K factor RskA
MEPLDGVAAPRKRSTSPATASRRGSRLLWRVVLVAIGVVAVAAVVVTAVQGHKTAAIAIGLLAAAFFCGMAC